MKSTLLNSKLHWTLIPILAAVLFLSSQVSNAQDSIGVSTSVQTLTEISEDDFKNLSAKTKRQEEVTFYWNTFPHRDFVIIRYKRKIDKEGPYTYTEPIPSSEIKYTLSELQGGQSFVWNIGASSTGDIKDMDSLVWSKKGKFTTKRAYDWFSILILLGALGFFIYGMKVMSEGIQLAAGSQMRRILSGMTRNRFLGVGTGFLITGLVQSSSATTVMTVSFVNAGLLTLVESAGIMMGANIGTTVTAWFLSLLGFKVKIAAVSLPIIAIGLPMMFASKGKVKAWGQVLLGFALLFMGLDELKHAVPDIKSNPEILAFLQNYVDMGYLSILLFVLIGTLLTIVVQSSSAAMALTLVMCANGWISFPIAAAMVLGENIGTTITAELASLVANVHAKRSARIHSMFNIIGVSWMLIFGHALFIKAITFLTIRAGLPSPMETAESIPYALSAFHTLFNLTNVILLIAFVPLLVRLAEYLVKSKGEEDEEFHLEHIGSGYMSTPELSILEAKKELNKFGKVVNKMNGFVQALLIEKEEKKRKKLYKKLKKYEEITDNIEIEIDSYLAKLSEGELSEKSSQHVRSMLSITGDLERVGDIYYQMSKSLERKNNKKLWFTPEQREKLDEFFNLLNRALELMRSNLEGEFGVVTTEKAVEFENEINSMRNGLRKAHLKNVGTKDYNIESGLIYTDLFNSCEKIGDHVINVSEAMAGDIP